MGGDWIGGSLPAAGSLRDVGRDDERRGWRVADGLQNGKNVQRTVSMLEHY